MSLTRYTNVIQCCDAQCRVAPHTCDTEHSCRAGFQPAVSYLPSRLPGPSAAIRKGAINSALLHTPIPTAKIRSKNIGKRPTPPPKTQKVAKVVKVVNPNDCSSGS